MRESVLHPLRPRLFRRRAPLTALSVSALCLALAGCSGDKKGQIILALQTDMSMPDDVTKVKIVVKADGVTRYDDAFTVDPTSDDPDKIPATLAVVAGEKDNETIELKIVALRERADGTDEPRTLNKTVTTIPKDRIAMLRVPMQWLCTGPDAVDDFGDGEYESGCPKVDGKEASCVAGDCKDVRLESSKLPDFSESAVFGGEEGSDGTCFPTEECFNAGVDVTVDMSDCTVAFSPSFSETGEDDSIINFAVVTQRGAPVQGGICSGMNCYVGLDQSRDFGWYELEDDDRGGEGTGGSGGDVATGGRGGGTTGVGGSGPGAGAPSDGSGGAARGGASSGGKSGGGVAGSGTAGTVGRAGASSAGASSAGTSSAGTSSAGTSAGGTGSDSGGQANYDEEDGAQPHRTPAGLRRFQLPIGVCNKIAQGEALAETPAQIPHLRASTDTSCLVTKTPRYPTCGPWSSVGGDHDPPDPPDPPKSDNDGDGVDSTLTGGTDCDDNDNTVFPGALETCDTVDNDCNELIDDSCLEDVPFSHRVDFSALTDFQSNADYAIYQAFDATRPLDLDQTTLTFTPNANATRYTVSAAALDWDSDIGELVPVQEGGDASSCDDCFTHVPIEFPFPFYGEEYTTVFPSSNGYLTFGVGDTDFTQNIEEFLGAAPRIAAFWLDLDTRGSNDETITIDDEILYFSSGSKIVVTYQNIQLFSQTGSSNTFQFVLQDDGTIKISYDGMDDRTESSLVGITPGSLNGGITCTAPLSACFGQCVDLETSTDHCGACGNICASDFCSAGACVGETICQVSNAPCPGTCVGYCQLDVELGGVCDGQCSGTCDGDCDPPDTGSGCNGTCDGTCTGSCYLTTGGDCADTCSGNCYVDSIAECSDPNVDATGPCMFQGMAVTNPTTCSDYASSTGQTSTFTYQLSCSGGPCMCCRQAAASSVCVELDVMAADVCESDVTVRETMMTECIQTDACGSGCPATPPATGDPCREAEITTCYYYSAATTIYCQCGTEVPGEFLCYGGT